MACERYQKDLDALAGGLLGPESATPFRVHLRSCAACYAAFEANKQVYMALDEGLRRRVNEELPAGFATRVHARVRANPGVSWRHAWLAWTGAAAVASLVLVLTLAQGWWGWGKPTATKQPTSPMAERPGMPIEKHMPNEEPTVEPGVDRSQAVVQQVRIRRKNFYDAELRAAAMPEVLILAGQEQAIAQVLEGLRSGELKGELLVADREDQATQELQILPLTIKPIALEPLDEVQQETNQSHK
ncbi:MAG TPA: hypothetical protein VOA41_04875 [Candidatus Dormibacteraeota bacterium]|nr:hypothetical protein [Candidatus Dormibacteraeota bacterium]